jgi:hypothetical protein
LHCNIKKTTSPELRMTAIKQEDLIQSVADAFQYISYYHPLDYIKALGEAYEREESPAAKDAIAQILTNSRMSAEGHRPICQDTGIGMVFIKVGMNVTWPDATMSIQKMIDEGVRRAYNNPDNPLRASVLADPAGARKNTKDNTPAVVHFEIVEGDHVARKPSPSSPCSTRPTTWSTGCCTRSRKWVPAGARPASSASASAARRKRPCCWPRNRSWPRSTSTN